MKIVEIMRADVYFLEVQEDDNTFCDYRTCGSTWEKRYSESWESVFDDEKTEVLDAALREFCKEKKF